MVDSEEFSSEISVCIPCLLTLAEHIKNFTIPTVLWRTDPFLGKDLEGKHAFTTIELLLETVFSIRAVQTQQLLESQPVKRRREG
jgi:hypothetical protein